MEQVFPSEELLDAMQQDLSDIRHRRRTRRRVVLSDDDAQVPQSGPGAVVSRRVVLVPGASGDTPCSVQGRMFERGDDLDRFETPSENALGANVEESTRTPFTVLGVSVVGEDVGEEPTAPEAPIHLLPRDRQDAFASLDHVELKSVFSRRARVLRTIPFILKGAFRSALRTALDEVIAGHKLGSESRMTRGSKLFMLLPRLLLHRPSRGGMVPRKKLEERIIWFQDGLWLRLLEESQTSEAHAHQASFRRRRNQVDSLDKRASKAPSLVQLGELSAARVSLEGAEVAPGTLTTLRELTNPERRPPILRQELSHEIARSEPAVPFDLDADEFLISLRAARRGAAGGPSGMTSEHLFPLLDSERDSSVLTRVATLMARCEVRAAALEGMRLGRLTALRKPDGGVRGIVVGDIMRRLG